MTAQTEELSRARTDFCRFLSACYYEPSEDFREAKLFASMLSAAQAIDPTLAETTKALGAAFVEVDMQTLLIDYTRLFLGPVSALAIPYGSRWLTDQTQLMQDSTLSVMELYAQGGFDVDDEFHDLPDHIAVELEFLYALTFQTSQAGHFGDNKKQLTLDALRQRFLSEHLGAWVGPFVEAVNAGAETTFYRLLAALTHDFIGLEMGLKTTAH